MCVAHNGVIREYNGKNNILNDTQLFIIEVINDLISNTKKGYYKSKTLKKQKYFIHSASGLYFLFFVYNEF